MDSSSPATLVAGYDHRQLAFARPLHAAAHGGIEQVYLALRQFVAERLGELRSGGRHVDHDFERAALSQTARAGEHFAHRVEVGQAGEDNTRFGSNLARRAGRTRPRLL